MVDTTRMVDDGPAQEIETERISAAPEEAFFSLPSSAAAILATAREPLLVLDEHWRVLTANPSFYRTFQVRPKETTGRLIYEIEDHQWAIPQLQELLETILTRQTVVEDFEVEHTFPGGRKSLRLHARVLEPEQIIILGFEVRTEQRTITGNARDDVHYLYDLFMQAPNPICILRGPDHIVELVNQHTLKVWRRTEAEVINKPIIEALPELEGQVIKDLLDDVYTTGRTFHGNEMLVQLDYGQGAPDDVYFTFVYEPMRSRTGAIDGVMVTAFVVTDQVIARRKVEEQNRVLEMITSGAPLSEALDYLVQSIEKQSPHGMKASILLLDDDGKHLRHGAAPSLPASYTDAIDGTAIGPAAGSCGTAAYIQEPVIVSDIATNPLWRDFKDLAERHDLQACWSTPIFSSKRDVLGTFAMYYAEPRLPSAEDRQIIDFATRTAALVIERRKAEEALRRARDESERRKRLYEAVTSSTPDLIYVFDLNYHFTYANEALLEMWGRTWEESRGKRLIELGYEPWHAEMHEREIDQIVATRQPIRGEVAFPHATLGRRIYDYILTPVLNANGDVEAVAGTTRDVTELRQLAQQKDEFIGIASHELKTPITSIKGYTQVLQRRFVRRGDDSSAQILAKMDTQLNKLTALVGDLLDVTRIEAGKLPLDLEPFAVDDLITDVVEEMQLTAEHHTIRIEGRTMLTVYGDRERIGQVLMNLLSNAIKYSPQADSVIVRCVADGKMLTVCVQDFGFGIPKSLQSSIFDRFYRVQDKQVASYPGLGLGLYISADIVARHGGQIWVESEEGQGSTFCFSLPTTSDRP